jgi:hypothetical protein
MLLLLRSPPSGATAAIAAIGLGLVAAGSIGTANLSTSFGLTLSGVELNVTGDVGFANKLTGISVGFLSAPATAIHMAFGLPAGGGFGAITQLTTLLGLTATVGSTLQGTAISTIGFGLTTAPKIAVTANPTIGLALAGSPITVSGGTITPSAVAAIHLSLNGAAVSVTSAVCDIATDISGTPSTSVLNLATQMRLSFSADEIRTFFRKG